ncbi:1-phosphatidylinositol 3-phosphate 5-kinase-like isoform X2 [Anopheles stephensi]|nr:1-phosphatidylinositol 3-phosphate 5-kinase-like isoform X2 [Anopheles stephensi]
MRVKTLRQIKNQRGHRNHHGSHHNQHSHVATNAAIEAQYFSPERLNALVNCMNPPYRMPPQPLGAYGMQHDHHSSIPGTASTEAHVLNTPLRTHSSKFPIERELILSSNKNSSKIPLMQDNRNTSIPALLNRSATSAIGPDLPVKQTQAWNQPQMDAIHSAVSGSMPRTIVRFPEDVTALADRDGSFQREKDSTTVKKSVTKTYHTLKDLISSKFKKDANEQSDELNNVTSMLHGHQSNLDQGQSSSQQQQQQQQQQQHHGGNNQSGSYMYSSASDNNLLQAQSNLNVWPSSSQSNSPLYYHKKFSDPAEGFSASKALSQPQLNIGEQSNRNTQHVVSMLPAPVDGTDSDDGGFRQHSATRQTNQPMPNGPSQSQGAVMHGSRSTPQQQPAYIQNYRHNHAQQQQQQQHLQQQHHMSYQQALHNAKQRAALEGGSSSSNIQSSSYNTTVTVGDQSTSHHHHHHNHHQSEPGMQKHTISVDINSGSSVNISTGESHDAGAYDKNGNHSSNIDSGRGSSSMATASADAVMEKNKVKSDGEWIDVVDVELRNILEPGMKSMNLRPESTMSESASSMSPPLPPLSPHEAYNHSAGQTSGSVQAKPNNASKLQKQEYGTDTYNRASKNPQPIGPSKGQPSPNTIQNYMNHLKLSSNKKHEQNALKKHLFGLDTDVASVTNTTRSLDLESLLGGPWDGAQSVSESETDGGGLQQIRNQLEGLETMYSEVLKMLGNRMATNESTLRANRRRRHGSMSSLPSSSISGRPIRDRRRLDERRKVRDIKGINKRFQRLESHVVTLARSVAHLSSEMRSQHLVSQELEELRNDLALLRSQSMHNLPMNSSGNGNANASAREPINLTNPKRVKKLTKFFGEDPPLMKLFLKKLGYEKYAPIFESERVGMIELPYLGEERLQKMGIPLGPRLRILQEAQISLCRDTTLCIV